MKKILIIKSHPVEDSFCNVLTNSFIKWSEDAWNDVKVLELKKLNLEKFLKFEYRKKIELTDDLIESQKLISWADQLVFSYPIWWATPPALLKVFIESVFESWFAFKYHKSTSLIPKWDKLLTNKTARIIATMDAPVFYYKLFIWDPSAKMMKWTLNFCWINKIKYNYFGWIKMSSKEKRESYIEKIYNIWLKQ